MVPTPFLLHRRPAVQHERVTSAPCVGHSKRPAWRHHCQTQLTGSTPFLFITHTTAATGHRCMSSCTPHLGPCGTQHYAWHPLPAEPLKQCSSDSALSPPGAANKPGASRGDLEQLWLSQEGPPCREVQRQRLPHWTKATFRITTHLMSTWGLHAALKRSQIINTPT